MEDAPKVGVAEKSFSAGGVECVGAIKHGMRETMLL